MSITKSLPGGDEPWKESPAWHREVIESRVKMLEDGTAEVEDWEDVERELDEQK